MIYYLLTLEGIDNDVSDNVYLYVSESVMKYAWTTQHTDAIVFIRQYQKTGLTYSITEFDAKNTDEFFELISVKRGVSLTLYDEISVFESCTRANIFYATTQNVMEDLSEGGYTDCSFQNLEQSIARSALNIIRFLPYMRLGNEQFHDFKYIIAKYITLYTLAMSGDFMDSLNCNEDILNDVDLTEGIFSVIDNVIMDMTLEGLL